MPLSKSPPTDGGSSSHSISLRSSTDEFPSQTTEAVNPAIAEFKNPSLTSRVAYSEENEGFLHGSGESSANQKGLSVAKELLSVLAEFLLNCIASAISKQIF